MTTIIRIEDNENITSEGPAPTPVQMAALIALFGNGDDGLQIECRKRISRNGGGAYLYVDIFIGGKYVQCCCVTGTSERQQTHLVEKLSNGELSWEEFQKQI